MMRMHDAAETLRDMHQHELGMQTLAEFKGYDKVAGQYREKAEALQTGISALEGLERNKAKAENAVKAMQICFGLAQDIERLLTLAYLQGGGDDEQS